MNKTIHWLGAGLSAPPGIKRLAKTIHPLIVWERNLAQAQQALANSPVVIDIRAFDWQLLDLEINTGDVVVSMLPATMHLSVATLCLRHNAHFVCSSYISAEMEALDGQTKALDLCFVNEVGLDPGIDHLMAHSLMAQYRRSEQFSTDNHLYFRSYCGGFPKIANDFKYKFSWSSLGVLKALNSPAKWLADGQIQTSEAPWQALSDYTVEHLDRRETFQAYPNRDSLPFVARYGLEPEWIIKEFVRGTLRLAGWSTAWQSIFEQVAKLSQDHISSDAAEQQLKQISKELEQKYSYQKNEPDRVVLSVELEAKKAGKSVWHRSFLIDASGNDQGQAMARLVSLPVSIAVEGVLNGDLATGVSAAPSDALTVELWLSQIKQWGEPLYCQDHLN
ncbi:MAG: saccharopine dehydrogenase family protein [Motiliproteus sp.]